MPRLDAPTTFEGDAASPALFGGNLLANRADLLGTASYAEAIDDLGVTGLRYPGGSITERAFDLNDPTATSVFDEVRGTQIDFIGIDSFLAYAEAEAIDVTIVLPTRTQLSDATDAFGQRLPEIEEDALRGFVRDVVTGVWGSPNDVSFQIGNEYWNAGEMSSFEYGRLAAEMAEIVQDTLDGLSETTPLAARADILVQMGTDFGFADLSGAYTGVAQDTALAEINAMTGLTLGDEVISSSGEINWTLVSNRIVLQAFDPDQIEAVDGVTAHVYSKGPDLPNTRSFMLETVAATWGQAGPELDLVVTEWNQSASTSNLEDREDYGLYQAQEMLDIVEEFLRAGVDEAHVWPLIQNAPSALSLGFDYTEPTPAGEMFAMMAEALPGKRALDFVLDDPRSTEASFDEMDVHGFAGDDELLLYVTATGRDAGIDTELDLTGLLEGFGALEAQVLGVVPGANPGANRSEADLRDLPPEEVMADGIVDIALELGEILELRFFEIDPTDAFRPLLTPRETAEAPPALPPDALPPLRLSDDDDGDGAPETALDWVTILLPLLLRTAGFG